MSPEKGRWRTPNAIKWSLEKPDKADIRFSGSYYLRSDRRDLDEKELWQLYVMLTRVEDSFRTMKTELGFRPVFHQKDERMEGHLFISVLAYHLIAFIQKKLGAAGISHRWKTIRNSMATQARITVSMTNDQNERIHIRQTTESEPFHMAVHRAMGLGAADDHDTLPDLKICSDHKPGIECINYW